MTTKRSLTFLLVALFSLPLLVGCGTSIRGGKMGLQFKPLHGGVQDKTYGDGFKWHLPWNPLVISPNKAFIFVPIGTGGVPLLLDTDGRASSQVP